MNITNIKLHTRVKNNLSHYKNILSTSPHIDKRRASFCVLRTGGYIYSCYFSGFINVTGIKTISCINEALNVLKNHFQLDSNDLEHYVIDNISSQYKGNLCSLLNRNLTTLAKVGARFKDTIKVKYNREKFPGLFLKTAYGTLICFSSSAIAAVGAKNEKDLRKLNELIEELQRLVAISNVLTVL